MRQNRYYSGPVSDHFDGSRFFNPGSDVTDKSFRDILHWRRTSVPAQWPTRVEIAPVVPDRRVSHARITIIGHATVLIQLCGLNIVTDPLWSERASPVGFAGPKRVSPPAVAFDHLPKIDVVLLSHNHYDHLDKATLRRLVARDQPLILTPLGNDTIVSAAVPFANITAGDWWDRHRLSEDVEVTLVPAHHWSARGLGDRRMALWCGFVIRARDQLIYFAGDTAYGDGRIFRSIRQNLGCPDVALLPIGAYAPRWFMKSFHADPNEAVTIMQDLGAAQAIGIHWGVFRLSDEGRDAPRIALEEALVSKERPVGRFRPAEPGYVWQWEG
ncbi:hypothetical protein F9L08_06190 [Brucella tritici]|uniref:Metallo-beta-lactamase domain-containing protein n=1 Tax=Brucella tritici TaxID=94626 RepID=A0A6L3YV37_9HYPH|nr:hypothetical protein F9L08_06190 [Brucella tritici]